MASAASRVSFEKPVPYADLLAHIRRFARNEFLDELARFCTHWSGTGADTDGRLDPAAPWLVSGAAAAALSRGYPNGLTPSQEDLAKACSLCFGLQRPGQPGDDLFTTRLVTQILYDQWPYLRAADLSHWARPVAIFADTRPDVSRPSVVMREGWDVDLLGASVPEFVSVGFTLYTAAKGGSGWPLPSGPSDDQLYAAHGGREAFDRIAEANFVSDVEAYKRARGDLIRAAGSVQAERKLREPFVFNPLVRRPLLRGIRDGVAVAPSVEAIALRSSCEGVVYEGIDEWGGDFTSDVGHIFESYVGRQFGLVSEALIRPEIVYRIGRDELKSVDWIIVRREAVLLIECKSALPRRDVFEANERFRAAHEHVGNGLKQINRTAEAIRSRVGGFEEIPIDRPIVGLVVTLGSFHSANDADVRSGLPKAEVPSAITDVGFVEKLVGVANADWSTVVDRIVEGVKDNAFEPRGVLTDILIQPNTLLSDAFDSIPAVGASGPRSAIPIPVGPLRQTGPL